MTVLHALSAAAVSKCLMQISEACKNVCSHVLTYLCALLPDAVPSYCEPSLPTLSLYWRDPFGSFLTHTRTHSPVFPA
jgi:hypothetical protein